jgi:Holliday junction resolvasome RuvABC endonuclease subunit
MILKILKGISPETVCSLDASTASLGFAIFTNKKLVCNGKIKFEGNTIYEKIGDAYAKTRALFDRYTIDGVVIEHTVFINSPKTAADLALVQGGILAALWESGVSEIGSVSPITWQSYIGNKRPSKEDRIALKTQYPDKSDSWLKSHERSLRKEKTIRFVNINYDREISDNDVADAVAIGHWALNNWNKAMRVEE